MLNKPIYTLMTKYFSQMNKNIIKKISKHHNQQGTQYSGKFLCFGNHIFSNKAKVTPILHTAHSGNDMNIAVGKCIKRSII